jgi:4-hydroxymandelate synthase
MLLSRMSLCATLRRAYLFDFSYPAQQGAFMVARDVEYVELFTGDESLSADYFESSLGFRRVAESDDDSRHSVLLRQGDAQLIVTSGPATKRFVDAHGDGVADIALACDDVATTRDAALAAGAEETDSAPGNVAVSGFGGVCHTLLPVPAEPGIRLPAGRTWIRASTPPVRQTGRIRLIDHIAICVEGGSLSDYAAFYGDAFGLVRYSSEYTALGDQAMDSIVVRSPSGGITYTLIASDPAKSPGQLDAFLTRNGGPGVQHLAFLVDDIILATRDYRNQGVKFLAAPPAYHDMLIERFADMRSHISDLRAAHVLADRDEWGYLLQLFTCSPHERNTLFYELIERRGARGFGSANIRALYEAVERERLAAG